MQHIKSLRYTLVAALAMPAGLLLPSCHTTKAEDEKKTDNTVQVKEMSLEKTQLDNVLELPGEIKPYQFADLYAKFTSYVKTVNVDMGSQVTTGQVLATLEAPEMNTQLLEAQSRLHNKEAVYQASHSTYERMLKTSKVPGTVSPNDLEIAFSKMSADSAELLSARSSLREVQELLSYLTIRAPFSGIITLRNVHPGTYVGPAGKGSDKPLLRLEEQQKLRLSIAVPESYTGSLQEASLVHFTVRSLPGDTFTAKVNRVAGSLDTKLRAEMLEMDINNSNKKLLPGMYAEVHIDLPGNHETFVVPKSAVITNSEQVFVIKVVNNKAVWVNVRKGNESNGKVEVFGNLNNGDVIVINGSDELKEGTSVQAVKE
ncbi:efflux RND transporter periplasmic adaptor subunit [Chitinophaga costaii]|nr:efflux RND transporter periplasmic adaptor subunit [Chitinophaga costaii]